MKKILIPAAALMLVAGGTALVAQMPTAAPGTKDAAKVTGGTYKVDGGHTQVVFAWDHMGFTNNMEFPSDWKVRAQEFTDQQEAEKAFKNGTIAKRRLQKEQASEIEGLEFYLWRAAKNRP